MKHLGGYPSPVIASRCWIPAQAKQEAPRGAGDSALALQSPARWGTAAPGSPLISSKATRHGTGGWQSPPAGLSHQDTCRSPRSISAGIAVPAPAAESRQTHPGPGMHLLQPVGEQSLPNPSAALKHPAQRPECLLLRGYFLF